MIVLALETARSPKLPLRSPRGGGAREPEKLLADSEKSEKLGRLPEKLFRRTGDPCAAPCCSCCLASASACAVHG